MAAKPLSNDLVEKIKADWRTGCFSQQKLADKWKVSKGVVNKLCKNLEQDVTDIVTAGIAYKSGLAAYDGRIVTAVTDIVDERTRHLELITNATHLNINRMMNKFDRKSKEYQAEMTIMDNKLVQSTIKDARESLLGKEAAPNTVNNTIEITPQASSKDWIEGKFKKINGTVG